MSKVDQILEGEEFPVDARLLCGFAARQAFIFEAILSHSTDNNPAGVAKCVTEAQRSLFAAVMQAAERYECDPTKTFDYWLDRTVPDSK